MEKITIPHTFLKGKGANATKFNTNFDVLKESVNNIIDEFDNKTNLSLDNLNDTGMDAIMPVGTVMAFLKNTAPANSRLLLCNGASVSRTLYSKLFSFIGTNFGTGDGSTTFNLPDYRGQFLRGLGGNSAANVYAKQTEGLPNITGNFITSNGLQNGVSYNKVASANGAFSASDTAQYNTLLATMGNQSSFSRQANFAASSSNSIYGASNHVTPENYGVYFFIRY